MNSKQNNELSPGTTLSHYRVVSTIGAGGMGEVYLAEDTKLERRVVLKILPHEFAADADRMRRFVLEAKSASALNHPNIITIYEVGEHNGTNFIATEYIDGRTLNNCDSLSLTKALDVATQIASALQAAHSAGIVHRDIKPDNVMIRPDGLVKVLDFGIAKQSGLSMFTGGRQLTDPEAATAVHQHTGTGVIIGTATYMSPEQARGKAIDSRSDIFSLGVLLYEMFSGRRPFTGENAMDVIGSIVADEPTPLRELRPSLPDEIDRIVSKALRKNRDERYQTAGELLVELKSVQRRLEFAELELSSAPDRRVEVPTQMIPAQTTAPSGSYNSIAVLPFSHLSADVDNEYFCDGLAEELLNALSKIENLRVAAKSSAFSFKGRNVNVSEIGRALNVNTVLEGSVRKSGERLRISVQLSNASDGYQLWSERYDRELKDIFDVQDEITLAVVNALKLRLLSSEKDEVLKRYTKNAEAYQLYLRGRFLFFKRTPEGFRKAIEYFKQAIELDSEYALAYSGLADCYTFLGFYEHEPPVVAENNLKAPAFRSLELDDTLAETHTSVALYRSLYQWDFVEGDKEHKKAIALNPQYALAHHLDSATVILLGKNDEAIAAESRAIELDPFTAIFNASLGWWFYLSSRNDEAIGQSLRTIEIAPNHFFAYWVLGLSYALAGKNEDAITALKKASSLTDGAQFIKADLGRVYAASGQRKEALQLLAELKDQSKQSYISPVNLAKIYFGLGDIEQTYEQLEKSVNEHSVKLPWLMIDPVFNNLRSESRFLKIWRRVGLPENQIATTESETVMFHSEALRDSERGSEPSLEPGTAEKRVASADSPRHGVSKRNSVIAGVVGVLIVTALALGGYWSYGRSNRQISSIAVMPFVNEGGNADVEYLSDGMTETLISSLSQLPNLSVKGRSSVFRYKGKPIDTKTIGKELGVQAVLYGRVIQRGDQLTLSLELLDALTENVIWSDKYDRNREDLVTLQGEIAKDVSTKLKSKLSGAEEANVTKTSTANPEAYQAYLKGRYYWNRRTAENLKKAIEQFKAATDRDPNYALAFVGLADCYIVLPEYAGTPTSETMPQAKAYAERAITIDQQLGEPHATLGLVNQKLWRWTEAEREFQRAIELNPSYATAYHWYSILLRGLGRFAEAALMIKRAQEIDPLSSAINNNVSMTYQIQNDHNASIENSLRGIELDPTFSSAHNILGLAYLKQGRNAEAITSFEKAVELSNRAAVTLKDLGYAYGLTGKRNEAIAIAKELEEKYARKESNAIYVAAVYAGLDDKDRAFEWLERGFLTKDDLSLIRWYLSYEPLRGDPRYKDLLKRVGLPE